MVPEIPKACINCVHCSHTGVGEIFHCTNDNANRHPLYRMMTLGESMTFVCDNEWAYRRPTAFMLAISDRAREFIL